MKVFLPIAMAVVMLGLTVGSYGAELFEEVVLLGGTSSAPGARAAGMGSAYTAVADDYNASYWNPAGLAQIRRIEIYGALLQRHYNNQSTYYGFDTDASSNFTKLASFGVVFPVPVYRGSLAFSIGYNLVRSWDRITSFKDDQGIGYPWSWAQAEELEHGRLGFWSFASAIDLSPNMSLGAALQYWVGRDDYTITGQEWDNSAPSGTSPVQEVIDTDLNGWRGSLGVLVRVGSVVRLGMTIMTPVVFDAEEKWSGTGYGSGTWDYRISEPFRIRYGVSASLGRALVALDLDWMDWSQIEYRSEPPIPGYSEAEANIALRRDFRPTLGISGGAEFLLPVYGLRVRAGGGYDPNPEKGAETSDGQTHFSAGLGILLDESIMVDVAFTSRRWEQNSPYLWEDISTQKVQLSIAYRF